jgi:hypothetical protein
MLHEQIRKRNADKRVLNDRARRGTARVQRDALACRRSTTALAAATERHRSAPANALPGTGLDENGCYPFPAVLQCSGLPRRPVIVPAGRITPEPPGSGGDEPPPAGTALAPPAGVTGWRPLRNEMEKYVTVIETYVKGKVADVVTIILHCLAALSAVMAALVPGSGHPRLPRAHGERR